MKKKVGDFTLREIIATKCKLKNCRNCILGRFECGDNIDLLRIEDKLDEMLEVEVEEE